MKIEQIKHENLTDLKALYENAFEGSTTNLVVVQNTYEVIKNNPNYHILCALIDNKVVGSVMGVICFELFGNCRPFMVVENVAVLSNYRKQGIAKKLLVKLEEIAKQQNCSMILFVSSQHRQAAHKLYESLGYGVDKVNGYRKRLE